MHNKPIALIILDGFGVSSHKDGNAVAAAKMPAITQWLHKMPHVTLAASGSAVGLPDGYAGNSEVGHYTIGAGRIVQQPTTPDTERPVMQNSLKEILCTAERSVFTIAETATYAYVTYFFNGAHDQVLTCEVRHLIPSLSVDDATDHPEMRAREITDTVLRSVEKDPKDFYLISYANADTVVHSGNFEATVKALEVVDAELQRLYNMIVEEMDGTLFITSDHSNGAQITNPVPFIVVTRKPLDKTLVAHMHGLADIAPLILKYMGIQIPKEMTGSRIL